MVADQFLFRIVLLAQALFQASAQAHSSVGDLQRARTKVPRAGFRDSAESLASVLNPHIRAAFPHAKPCEEWTVMELQALQVKILKARSAELNEIYGASADPRYLNESAATSLWEAANMEAVGSSLAIQNLQRNAHCREAVLWLVHHLTERERIQSFKHLPVPFLGEHLPEMRAATEQSSACGMTSAAPAVCAHARASSVCGSCHVGSKDTPPTSKPPADTGAPHQPLWPTPLPDSLTMNLRVYYERSGQYTLNDEVVKDYRYRHGQQLFVHSASGHFPNCTVLIENATTALSTSNVWAWIPSNGTTKCLKLWQGIALIPHDFVRTSGGFARSGRQQLTEPTTGEVRDAWSWCRENQSICYYEDVHTHVPVQYNPTGGYKNITFGVVETYSNVTRVADRGPVQLPEQCPGRDAEPLWSDNSLAELGELCAPLYASPKKSYIVV